MTECKIGQWTKIPEGTAPLSLVCINCDSELSIGQDVYECSNLFFCSKDCEVEYHEEQEFEKWKKKYPLAAAYQICGMWGPYDNWGE